MYVHDNENIVGNFIAFPITTIYKPLLMFRVCPICLVFLDWHHSFVSSPTKGYIISFFIRWIQSWVISIIPSSGFSFSKRPTPQKFFPFLALVDSTGGFLRWGGANETIDSVKLSTLCSHRHVRTPFIYIFFLPFSRRKQTIYQNLTHV